MTSKLFSSLLILSIAITLISSAPTAQEDFKEITNNVSKNLTTYIIAGVVVLCVIIALLCWTAAKGCCCIFKIALLAGCGIALFFIIFKGTYDYKEWKF